MVLSHVSEGSDPRGIMKMHWLDEMDGLIIEGDIIAALAQLEDESVEAIITDPPYELNFMGKSWDNAGVSFRVATWEACRRVLKPGGHLVVFGGTRTHHRMWCAIEDAGFEMRDMLLWMYGQGLPKSMNVGKAIDKAAGAEREVVGYDASRARPNRKYESGAIGNIGGTGTISDRTDNGATITAPATEDAKKWDGWGTALKPACEPILLARKPLSEKTVAANVLKHGTGALNIDASRIGNADVDLSKVQHQTSDTSGMRGIGEGGYKSDHVQPLYSEKGRWPANVMLQCICDNPQPVPEKARKRRGEPSQERRYDQEGATNFAAEPGVRREGGGFVHEPDCPAGMLDMQSGLSKSPKIRFKGASTDNIYGTYAQRSEVGHEDFGGASRFFYCPKTSKKERGEDNTHPTVKPLALMRWLVRLVTPPDGVVLDPFCGSGSTLIAATEEGFGFIGVDVNEEYVDIAQRRLKGRNA